MLNHRNKSQQEYEIYRSDSERESLLDSEYSSHKFNIHAPLASNQETIYISPTQPHNDMPTTTNELQPVVSLPIQRRSTRDNSVDNPHGYYQDLNESKRRSSSVLTAESHYDESYSMYQTSYSRAIDISNSYKQQANLDFIYYSIQPGDTLHNLSVKYSCPIASIKRLNNLWSDQEFYGLSKIKLPTGKLRLLADVINEESAKFNQPDPKVQGGESLARASTSSTHPRTLKSDILEPNEFLAYVDREDRNSNHLDDDSFKTNHKDSIFKDLDLNIEKARTAARYYDNNANAILQSLVDSGNVVVDSEIDDLNDPNKIARREAENLLNDMTDFGMTYSGLILFIFIVCLICPLAYIIYLEETHHDSNKIP